MSKGHEILKQLLESGSDEALASKENMEKALKEQGCTQEEIDSILSEFGGFPLDDEDLAAIAGGMPTARPAISDPASFGGRS